MLTVWRITRRVTVTSHNGADANLMAAAPDMLAALEEIVFHDPNSPAAAVAKQAIAKAVSHE